MANNSISSLVEDEIVQNFAKMTDLEKQQMLAKWTTQVFNWINKARIYVESEQIFDEKISKNSKQSLDNFKEIFKRKRASKKSINNEQILTEGYVLLNQIGEIIRGEEIFYSVTLSKTGAAISSGASGTGGVYTWKISLKEFLGMLNFSSTRITLKSSTTLYKMMEAQINDDDKSIEYERWTEQKIEQYTLFYNQVRNNPNLKEWHNVNEGNMLEAFLRFLDDRDSFSHSGSSNHWKSIGSAMKRTMMAPDPFFIGGDLRDIQIKGLNASVTNINTLIQNLERVLTILRKSQSGYDVIKKYYKKNASEQINEEGIKTQEEIIKELTEFFTSKIDRSFTIDP